MAFLLRGQLQPDANVQRWREKGQDVRVQRPVGTDVGVRESQGRPAIQLGHAGCTCRFKWAPAAYRGLVRTAGQLTCPKCGGRREGQHD